LFKQIKLKVLAFSIEILTNFEYPLSNPLKDHKMAIFTLKIHTGSQGEVCIREHRPITE
jgi:hypothetical protein